MFAVQCVLLLVVWIGYGIFQWRQGQELKDRLMKVPRRTRVWAAIAVLFGGAVSMLFGLWLVQSSGGMVGGQLEWWAWAVIVLVGLAFVHGQTLAAGMMVTLVQDAVTTPPEATSTKVEQDRSRE